jgi:hypothetical protein
MTYNKERHKQLVIRSQDLKNQGKNLFLENPEEDSELSKYNIGVEEQVFWTHQENFVLIMKNFIDNILDFDEFETVFNARGGTIYDNTLHTSNDSLRRRSCIINLNTGFSKPIRRTHN